MKQSSSSPAQLGWYPGRYASLAAVQRTTFVSGVWMGCTFEEYPRFLGPLQVPICLWGFFFFLGVRSHGVVNNAIIIHILLSQSLDSIPIH